ncbi:hypothetical protein BO94DRAFT_393873 [Aspergillus sclerotioniger CBS 115572]|uniref:Uncharacterized protein n=1 Tax=Aspergillus sclerotioniger CBS 115572 TaxID=1450535 RepID=A0A317X1H6_9EURO|nr:hypothetical protein BO94DRAFT_393873 [Aspergillus sclerotioniger CBS 115572]PWY91452.1 hypothetical protein BO94DRAFT_393873 [Aspergillus sclerotioniger CBS 115572]
MVGLLTEELGWPVGFWSRYSPFGVLLCTCIRRFFPPLLFVSFSSILHFFSLCFSVFCHEHPRPVGVGGLYLPWGSVRLGLLFPAHSGGFRCYSIIVRVWLRVRPKHAGFNSATGFLFGFEKVAFYRFELVLGTLAKGTAGMPANHQKSYRSLIC